MAYLCHAGVERRITDVLVRPYRRVQFLFRDHTVAMGKEVGQHMKHLGAEFDRLPNVVQFASVRIEDILTKRIAHCHAPPIYGGAMFSAIAEHGAPIGKPCQYYTKITRYAVKQAMRPDSSVSDHSAQAIQLATCLFIPLSLLHPDS